ncbi:ABC transporter permease [Effusibacillus lacus]|uniref:ABC transporter permease n=1 Tax=Effusibacillus lacus TaxID=1348429 RepID=A0A292YGE8_9BACL|nr:ABC transporter permease [Effusibacillus lacus]TCS71846.1 Cu-processing system permease protein [Effusibacillus lacus]GAX89587.1 ABC transporter permease [Effusibacillus lacus]
MNFWIVAKREIKLGFRNPWSYSFLALFTLFSLALLLIQSQNAYNMQGYTHAAGTMMNLTLYLLPLMTLLLGSFSVTSEKEDGSWQLLSTYSLSSSALLIGKFMGLTAVLLAITCFAYGLSGIVGSLVGHSFALESLLSLLLFSIGIVLLYLGIAVWIGSLSRNRWQALTYAVGIWFATILAWPTLLLSVLGFLPYWMIQPSLEVLTLLNPAEFVRVFAVMKLGGGSVFGPEYYRWVNWAERPMGTLVFLAGYLVWIGESLGLAIYFWERGRYRG